MQDAFEPAPVLLIHMSLVRVQLPESQFTTLRKKQFFEGVFHVKNKHLCPSARSSIIPISKTRVFLGGIELFIIFTAVINTIKNEILFLLCVRDNF